MFKRNFQNGVSMISLIITIIVLIIIASVAFSNSGDTITNATFSTYVSGVADVEEAFQNKASTIQGEAAAKGIVYSDSQVYDYLAKDGKSSEDFLDEDELPAYTIIEDNNQLGIKMKEMYLPSGKKGNTKMRYAVTQDGTIFTWPPFESDGKLYVNSTDVVESREKTTVSVGSEKIFLRLDGVSNELVDSSIGSVSRLVKDGKIKAGDYIDYEKMLTPKTYFVSKDKSGHTEDVTLTTDTNKKWKVIYSNTETGEAWIVPEGVVNNNELEIVGNTGYIYGQDIIEEACRILYSTEEATARSMTGDDFNMITGYDKTTYVNSSGQRYGDKTQFTMAFPFGPGFMVHSDADGISGGTFTGTLLDSNVKAYQPSETAPVTVTYTDYFYNNMATLNPNASNIIGDGEAWLASRTIRIQGAYPVFSIQEVNKNGVATVPLCTQFGIMSPSFSLGILPVISLKSSFQIENYEDVGDTSGYEWRIAN